MDAQSHRASFFQYPDGVRALCAAILLQATRDAIAGNAEAIAWLRSQTAIAHIEVVGLDHSRMMRVISDRRRRRQARVKRLRHKPTPPPVEYDHDAAVRLIFQTFSPNAARNTNS